MMSTEILSPEKGKVSPEVLQVMYLDEISIRLEDLNNDITGRLVSVENVLASVDKRIGNIHDYLDSTSYKGDIRIFKKVITGGEGNKKITCNKKWYEHTIVNDGPDDVYIESAAKSMSDTPIEMGEEVTVKAKRGSTDPVWLRCGSGETATARVVFKL